MKRVAIALVVSVVAINGTIRAADDAPVPTRLEGVLACPLVTEAPTIDGKLGDAVWARRAQPLRGFSYKTAGVNYQTQSWLCRDERYFYLAARCFDDSPAKLVAKNEALWRNDCLELFIVPEKKARFFTHFIIDCDGKFEGRTWVPDEWDEATAGPEVKLDVKTGREARAWTVEAAIPIAAFGVELKPTTVWSFGLNREKWTEPVEVSSFQGGFNKPREYPDLVFDDRTLVFDGLGVKNIGDHEEAVALKLAFPGSGARPPQVIQGTLKPGARLSAQPKLPADLKAGDEFTLEIVGSLMLNVPKERYLLVGPAKPLIELDVSKLPKPTFAPSPLDDPSFFPIGVWLQPAGSTVPADYKKMGVNVYYGGVDSYPNPRGKTWLDALHKEGMYGIIGYSAESAEARLHEHPATLGWHVADEPDQSNQGVPAVSYDELAVILAKVRALSPAKPLFMNLSCGVADERWIGRGLKDADYPKYCSLADVVSYDIYPCNSLGADGPDRLHMVAKGMDRLTKWTGGEKPLWFILEVNRFTQENVADSRAPTPDEVKTQMWMAIVHGARGLTLFCHSWYQKSTWGRIDPEMRAALTRTTGEIHALAPVLNSPSFNGQASVKTAMGGRVDVLVKVTKDAVYVFAVNMYRKPEKATFVVSGVSGSGGDVEVLFEGRTVPMKLLHRPKAPSVWGEFTDEFAPYAVHRYTIPRQGSEVPHE